jgi:cytidylate kinase
MSARVIAIDGPAYVGKSSISKALSELTGFTFINTGHMYRAVAKKCLGRGVLAEDESSVAGIAQEIRIDFKRTGADTLTLVDGEDVTHGLDASEIVLGASRIAKIPALREILTSIQRGYAQRQTIIMEGRDIGSQVFPDAEWKFFITASLEVRARRMLKMMDLETRKKYPDAGQLWTKTTLNARSRLSGKPRTLLFTTIRKARRRRRTPRS